MPRHPPTPDQTDLDDHLHFLSRAGRLFEAMAAGEELVMNKHSGRDAVGRRIPFHAREAFRNKKEFCRRLETVIRNAQVLVQMCGEEGTDRIHFFEFAELFTALPAVTLPMLPFAVCPKCIELPTPPSDCLCNGSGWLTHAEYQQAIDDGYRPADYQRVIDALGEQAQLWARHDAYESEHFAQRIDSTPLKATCRVNEARPAKNK